MPNLWRDLPGRDLPSLLRYLRLLLVANAEQQRGLTRRQRALYYLRRPFRLLKHYTPALWGLLRRRPGDRAAWEARRDLMAWLRTSGDSLPHA